MTPLSPEHRAELNGSRIAAELIEGRGYRTIGPEWRDGLRAMGCPGWAIREDDAFPGLVIPMYDPKTGDYVTFQFKPAVPQVRPGTDKPMKYVSPAGVGNKLDVHPLCRNKVLDPAFPLWITEGVKKGDALASHGLAVISMKGVFGWRNGQSTLSEWEDIPLKGRTVVVCYDADAVTNPDVRHGLVRLVGWLRKKVGKEGHAEYLIVPREFDGQPVKGADDYLAAGGTIETLATHRTDRAPQPPVSLDAAFSDAFLTDRVCGETLSGKYLWARGLGWMRYDGSRWVETDDRLVIEDIRVWAKAHFEDAVEEYKTDQSKDVRAQVDGWRQILNSGRLKALASLAAGPLHAAATDFDAHPDLLNCPNGVVDLRTGELLDPDPEYRFTKVAGAAYVPGMTDPDFTAALRALPEEVLPWYQVRVGQAFTGYMASDDMMIVQQGGGENGKSTLAVPLSRAAGAYQVLLSDRVILGSTDQHPTELMELKGARYALMEETPEARQLNVHQLKRIVGTPQITARKIRQDSVTFDATHSLFVNTNYLPSVVESDRGTWRRLTLLKFPYTFKKPGQPLVDPMDREGDPALRDRCQVREEPAMAALAWAVAGAMAWYAAGKVFPPVPAVVEADSLEWREEGDLVLSFFRACMEPGPQYEVKTQDVFQAFGRWLVPTGHKPWTQKTFKSRFAGHDLVRHEGVRERRDGRRGVLWSGVRLREEPGEAGGTTESNPFAQPG